MKRPWGSLLVIAALFVTFSVTVFAGVPRDMPPLDDPELANFLRSMFNHLNTLQCLGANPDGSVLGDHGELKCAAYDGNQYLCMNTGGGPQKTKSWTCLNVAGVLTGTCDPGMTVSGVDASGNLICTAPTIQGTCGSFDVDANTGPTQHIASGDTLHVLGSGGITTATSDTGTVTITGGVCGSDTWIQFNDAGACGADAGFTFNKTTNLVDINEATDGNSVLLELDNTQANSAASTNETAQVRFGMGSDTNVADILAGKVADYTTTNNSDAFIAFKVDADNVSREAMRISGQKDDVLNSSVGVSIGTTSVFGTVGSGTASLSLQPFGATVNDSALIAKDYSGTYKILDVRGDNSVYIGDTTYTAALGVQILSGSQSSLLLSGNTATNPMYIRMTTTKSPSWSSDLRMDQGASPSLHRGLEWTFNDLAGTGVEVESPDITFNAANQILTLGSGTTYTNQRAFIFNPQTINGVAGGPAEAVTNAATVYIKNAPSGSNVTLTNPYALWVDDGAVRFDGAVTYNSTIAYNSGTAITSGTSAIYANTYTPTLTNVANLDASTAYACQYAQVFTTVTGSCRVDVDPTLTVTQTQLGISLPVASNFANAQDAAGSCGSVNIAGQVAGIHADAANDRLEMQWKSGDVSNQEMDCSWAYTVK